MNIYNKKMAFCGNSPLTGFYRDGYCNTGDNDIGTHTVCSKVNQDFLDYTKLKGNDLTTASSNFPGLKPETRVEHLSGNISVSSEKITSTDPFLDNCAHTKSLSPGE